jgi:hypothetical protein
MSKPEIEYGEYFNEINAKHTAPDRCAGVEISGVVQLQGPGDKWGSQVDNANPDLFSVYLRHTDGTATCIGDFEHYGPAYNYADEIDSTLRIGHPELLPVTDHYFKAVARTYDNSLETRALGMAGATCLCIDLPEFPSRNFACTKILMETEDLSLLPDYLQVDHPHSNLDAADLQESIDGTAAFFYEHLQSVQNNAITQMRLAGYAIVRFSPEELTGVEPKTLENRLVELGNQAIEDLRETPDIDAIVEHAICSANDNNNGWTPDEHTAREGVLQSAEELGYALSENEVARAAQELIETFEQQGAADPAPSF